MKKFYSPLRLANVFTTLVLVAASQAICLGQSANLDQSRNGSAAIPISPVEWVNGNAGPSNSHFIEGQSIPYRLVMTGMTVGQSVTVTLAYNTKHSDKHGLDYLTHFDRLVPHCFDNHSQPEIINPLSGLNLISPTLSTFPIPEPDGINGPVSGQPEASFNALPSGERLMSIYNGTISSMSYALQQPLNTNISESQISITFVSSASTVVLAWGGHIASRNDWGFDANGEPRSAQGINGSPYHMSLVNWSIGSLGNTDKSLQAAAVKSPPSCAISGSNLVCGNVLSTYSASSDAYTVFDWTISGNGTIVGSSTGSSVNVQPGSSGSYTLSVQVVWCGIINNCLIDVDISQSSCGITGDTQICSGESTVLTASAGMSSYLWSTGATTQSITVSAGGNYSVTTQNSNGCRPTCSITVNQTPALSASISAQSNVLCFGDNTGSATVSVSGGSGSYAYSWNTSPVQTTAAISGLSAGSYTVTVTDIANNGCNVPATATANITQPSAELAVALTSQTNVLCFGAATGAINITASGGVAPYSFDWADIAGGSNSEDRSNLAAGSYSVIVTDANGCSTSSLGVTISQPSSSVAVVLSSQTNVLCFGATTGAIDITASGGVLPYSFDWADIAGSSNSEDRSNLPAGSYSVIVTDANGCSTSALGVTISQPGASVAVALTSQTNVLCFGAATGAINISASGGVLPYSFDWADIAGSSNSEDRSSLAAGSYSVIVTDANGCSTSALGVAISQPGASVAVALTSQTNVLCFGAATGAINISASGGVAPYTFDWADIAGSSNSEDRSNLPAGSYSVIVTDANGCSTSALGVTISQPSSSVAVVLSSQTNVLCFGAATGAINITASGGVLPYSFDWADIAGSSNSEDRSNLSAGSYSVVVTDANGCYTSALGVTISQPSASVAVVLSSQTNVLCFGAATGAINITASGGVLPYSFDWADIAGSSNSEDRSNLPAGSYSVIVTDANGCSTSALGVTISQPGASVAVALLSQTNVLCFGAATGAINISASGGVAPYTFDWADIAGSSNSEDRSNLSAGSYSVIVTDANGCSSSSLSVTISQPASAVSVSLSSQANVLCFGASTGSINITPSGGVGPYTFDWADVSGSSNSEDRSNLPAGTYSVVVTDANGCSPASASLSVTISQPASSVAVVLSSQTNVSCFGPSTGAINITASGGVGPYTFDWADVSGSSNSEDRSNLAAGTYSVVVTDANGCSTAPLSVTITQPASAVSVALSSQTNVLCFGATSGAINITASGGVAPYTFDWADISGSSNSEDRSNLAAGTYSVVVTDANGCLTAPLSVTISQPASAVSVALSSQANVLCFGASTGSINITPAGGVGPYTFDWADVSGSSNSEDRSNLPAGTYSVVVTDANGCSPASASLSVTISQPASAVAAVLTSQTNVLCFGAATGAINITASGGVGPYSFDWADIAGSSNSEDRSSLAAGSYSVIVTDANGCSTAPLAVTISQPASSVAVALTSQTNVLCFGATTGAINITASGGVAPYTFDWADISGSSNSEDRSNLAAGSYSVIVRDANGCFTSSLSVTISQPSSSVAVALSSQTNVLCFGAATGAINISASGGVAPYTFDWADIAGSSNSEDRSGLAAGSYSVVVTDANGCSTSSLGVTITQPGSALSVSLSSQTNILCYGANSGSASVVAAGGSGSYSFSWNTSPIQTTATASGLTAGTYTVTVFDNNGCNIPVTASVTITQPQAPLAASITSQTNGNCFGGANGSATVTATGGSGSYSYSWNSNPVQTTATASGLPEGSYTVTVLDNNGCNVPASATAVITNPSTPLSASISAQSNVLCFGAATGSATVSAIGGSGSYSFSWNTNPVQTSATASGLSAGSYTVTVTDNNGCAVPVLASVTISQPAAPLSASISSHTNVLCFGAATGSATVSVSGGSGSYNYSWNTNPVQTSATASGLIAGNYTVTVFDNNGCDVPVSASVVISQPSASVAVALTSQTNVLCFGATTGSINITASGGVAPYNFDWADLAGSSNSEDRSNLSAGSYSVIVTDANGCFTSSLSVIISQPSSSVTVALSSQSNVLCFSAATGSINITASGGVGPYTFDWADIAGSSNSEDRSNLSAGSYSVIVTDANGCSTASLGVTISQPSSSVAVALVSQSNVLCFGAATGSINISASGGVGPYSFDWADLAGSSNSEDRSGLLAGSYSVIVTDANGCSTSSLGVTISQPASALAVVLSSQTNILCFGDNSGSASVIASGGSGSYSFSWNTNPVQTTATASGLTAGSYTVTVFDNNGCDVPVSVTVVISQPDAPLSASISAHSDVLCFGAATGSATVSVSGGSGSYSYSWNTSPVQTSATASGLIAGSYTVTVFDNNGCDVPVSASVVISQPDAPLSASISASSDVLCFGAATGSASVSVSGGSGSYSYTWNSNPVQTTATASGLIAGSYTVTVFDNNGCDVPVSASVIINQPDAPLAASITSQINGNCFGEAEGSATVTATGGSGSYSYSWNSNPEQTTATASGLPEGTYTVTVLDNNGCEVPVYATAVITNPSAPLDATISAQSDVLCFGAATGSATVSVIGGSGSYSYSWNTNPVQTSATASGLSAGSYTVTITDNNGCTIPVFATVVISQPDGPLSASISAQSDVLCFGAATGSATVSVSGGSGSYNYSWNTNPEQTTATASGLSAGSYTVTVFDNNGCDVPVSASVVISQPDAPLAASISAQSDVLCFGAATGSASVSVSGGSGSYSFSWNTNPEQSTATASGLSAGSYTVTVFDNNGCDVPVTATVVISQPEAALAASISELSDVLCFGAATGSATVTATGGSGSYSYSWNTVPEQTTATASGLSAGSYTVTVFDNNGCDVPVSASAIIAQPDGPLAAAITAQSDILCSGAPSGSATVTASGGSGSYSYSWNTSPEQTAATASGLSAGTYIVTVFDNNGCDIPATASVTINQPDNVISVSISDFSDVLCFGAATGSATASVSGGSGNYSYSWNTIPEQTTATATGLSAGTYTVTVIDNNGCDVPVSASATISQPEAALAASISAQSNVLCFGSNTGSATALATGGSGSYNYSWNTVPEQTSATAIGLSAGSYTVTIFDNNGCDVPVSATVVITQPASALAAAISAQSNVLCYGASTGSATVTASGGSGSYSYSWNTVPEQTSATASGLSAGSYTVTVFDNNGCDVPALASVTITQPASGLQSSISAQTNVLCFGGSTGSATVSVTGGSGSYSYSWNTVPEQTSATASGLSAGSYTVTVFDNNGCDVPSFATVTITQPADQLAATIDYFTNVLCFGDRTGSATVTASGGSGSYSYSWNTIPEQTTATASGLTAGTYTVTVFDNNGCDIPVTVSVTITQPEGPLSADITDHDDVLCFGASTGSATVTASGGSGSYSYSWSTSPVQTNATVEGLSAGTYTVTIYDNNGCDVPVIVGVTITQPDAGLSAIISDHTDNVCFGGSSGTATVTASGGSGSYSYSWNTVPEQTSATAEGLSAGSYIVTVYDNNGCDVPVTATAEIGQPDFPLDGVITNFTNVDCYGNATGSATAVGSGGSGSYTFSWNTIPVQTTNTITGLVAGSYVVTIVDNNGCLGPVYTQATATITQPDLLEALAASPSYNGVNISCHGGSNGSIDLDVTGGTSPYNFDWSGPEGFISDEQNPENLSAGTYTVVITDRHACSLTVSITLTEPAEALISEAFSSPATCFAANGSAELLVLGGTPGYSFIWSNGSFDQNLANVTSGLYTVIITDANGCSRTDGVNIESISNIDISSNLKNVVCNGGRDGSIDLIINNGTEPYNFQWSNGSANEDLHNAVAGDYSVYVVDGSGCTFEADFIISEPSALEAEISSPTFFGGYNVSSFNGSDGSIDLSVDGGSSPYLFDWSNGATTEDLFNLHAGTYSVKATDTAGCEILREITLREPDALAMPTGYSPNADGKNDNFVIHGIDIFPNNVLTIFNRWGNIVFQADSYHNEWNGQNLYGEEMPAGTYFAILEINGKEIVLTGYVDLRRQ